MTTRWMRWTLGILAISVAATFGFACDHDKAETKDAKAVAGKADAKGCDMPCCAHGKDATDVKAVADGKAAPAQAADDKPCAAHDGKGCPKKAAVATAKVETVKEAPKADPAAASGTQR